MSTMLPVVVLALILLVAGYVVYRSIVEERRGRHPGGHPGEDPPSSPSSMSSTAAAPEPAAPSRPQEHVTPPPARTRAAGAEPAGAAGNAPRGKARPRRRRGEHPPPDPALADHVGALRGAVDAQLISLDEAVASLIRSSGGALDDDSARAILSDAAQPSQRGSAG